MASFFNSLPREIRDEIYGYLLGDDRQVAFLHLFLDRNSTSYVQVSNSNVKELTSVNLSKPKREFCLVTYVFPKDRKDRKDRKDPPTLFPHVLRVCRQMYIEAVPILYARKVFEYWSKEFFQWLDRSQVREIPEQTLGLIQDLNIFILGADFATPDEMKKMLSCFEIENSSLKRFRLTLDLYKFKPRPPRRRPVLQDIINNKAFNQAIMALRATQKIEFVVEDDDKDVGPSFEAFIHAVANARAWYCKAETVSWKPHNAPRVFKLVWDLTPAGCKS